MPKSKHLDTLLELKDDPSLSQRSLAHKLNISLGLTNAILQNLIHRGWIKAKKLTGRKILYLITPRGMAKATILAYERFKETQNYYQYTKDLLTAYLTKLYNQGKREAIVYGTGQLAEVIYLSLLDTPLKFYSISIISDDPSKKKFLGQQLFLISDFIKRYSQNFSPTSQNLIILSTTNSEKLLQEIKKYENIYKNIKIINIEDILKSNQ